jgi:hypothetical protein
MSRFDLLGRLPRPEDDFGETDADRAVMIDLRIPEVFIRQMAHPLHRLIELKAAFLELQQQLFQSFLIHKN